MISFFKKINGGQKLLIAAAMIYLLILLFSTQKFMESVNMFWDIFLQVIPIIFLVFIIMFFSNLLMDSRKIVKMIESAHGVKAYLFFMVFGILSSGPIYLWYPLMADLKEKKIKNSLIVIFLYNRAVKIPLLPVMIYYFGFEFVLVFMFLMIVFSIFNGLIAEKLLTQKI